MSSKQLSFDSLVVAIENTHETFATQAAKAVNICLTVRNQRFGRQCLPNYNPMILNNFLF